ncbi:hypothetical protein SAY87_028372 [Trapa incisa]|uniref:Uncharacterized protein n=1 Tax=Trapa incisa TaxID=236973 RepID=A0AAN7KP78_9MYRT|nr:hypothetical protein SAY87_028372 [Trapa incisa]
MGGIHLKTGMKMKRPKMGLLVLNASAADLLQSLKINENYLGFRKKIGSLSKSDQSVVIPGIPPKPVKQAQIWICSVSISSQ